MSEQTVQVPARPERKFLPENFKVESWEGLKPYFDDLLNRDISDKSELRKWLQDRSELESVISEDAGWRYIRMTRFTDNEEYNKSYIDFVQNIQPHIAPYSDSLNKKVVDSPFVAELEAQPGFDIMLREIRKDIEIFREENIPLFTEIQTLTQKYGQISGAMTVDVDGKELTLQQAGVMLQETDRDLRERIYFKIAGRRIEDKDKLDDLFNQLIGLRTQVARNSGFDNFRDYMFRAMGRFDYSPEDCFNFHDSVKDEIVPMLSALAQKRKEKLGLDELKPWDKAVDPENLPPLKPFKDSKELTEKTIRAFSNLDPFLGECLRIMREMGHLDLESRKGKAPGGYNYPLSEIGVPFIFMNATSTLRDLVTLLHEGGHAVHSFLTRDLELTDFKHTPSEVAELASMSMELISMDQWHLFFENENDLKRAKQEHLEQIIETLPWVATIDKFQHWIYENPGHDVAERTTAWNAIFADFTDTVTSWEGQEKFRDNLWQKQLHLYEVPFYYIEYGMAQLGAVAVWKNFRENPEKGLAGYLNALKLGYTKSIPDVYAAADIRFDFSRNYIRELMSFVREELDKL
ncbi:M3 family oligoendopeptidase [Fulvivirga sedimenti]|uniref:M3 family oligoendopeptidase n=1 Tax=Fulvivirga sedimenti TaxID=2879465 RepID=A0A9X1HW69_9BACT|nr:M3 family oligoendopeptidase [Fulvivirga sedimenti]MCA6075304.1 M3 family oligoendopeptidase [Fulvivirga sedimenti]MCA6076481.1 M3 family oligoendopeptidase [Fulvivirga sedimenti]MCA6077609.1 M3 family oligoendopeptidase [Fulvivirga sedimenti]